MCPWCGGEIFSLGTLGDHEYGRCRDCGMDWRAEVLEYEGEELEAEQA